MNNLNSFDYDSKTSCCCFPMTKKHREKPLSNPIVCVADVEERSTTIIVNHMSQEALKAKEDSTTIKKKLFFSGHVPLNISGFRAKHKLSKKTTIDRKISPLYLESSSPASDIKPERIKIKAASRQKMLDAIHDVNVDLSYLQHAYFNALDRHLSSTRTIQKCTDIFTNLRDADSTLSLRS